MNLLRRLFLSVTLVLLASPAYAQDFKNYIDSQWNANVTAGENWTAMSTSNGAIRKYFMQPVLQGLRTTYQAFDDITYLNRLLQFTESSMTSANITDNTGAKSWNCTGDFACWSGQGITNGGSFLSEITAVREMARVVQLINSDTILASTVSPTGQTYGTRALAIRSWLHTNMVVKWIVTRNQINHALVKVYDDKAMHVLHLVMALSEGGLANTEIKAGLTYRQYALQILNAHMAIVSAPATNGIAAAGAEIWYFNQYTSCGNGTNPCSMDTSHGNRWPDTLQYASDLGFGSSISMNTAPTGSTLPQHVAKIERLFTEIIWDGSTVSPRFTNLVDGDNDPWFNYPAWQNGYVAQGWASVAHHHADATAAMVAMTNCVISTSCTSPSRPNNAAAPSSRFALAATTAYAQFRLMGGGTPTPNLSTSPTSLTYQAFVGGSNPATQNLTITDPASSGALSWVVTDDVAWISVNPAQGENNGTVTVSVNTTGLAAGVHNGNVTVTAAGADGSPDVIPVTLTMVPPTLTRTPTTLSFAAQSGTGNPASKSITIEDTANSGVMQWTITDDAAWISVTPSSGTDDAVVTVNIDITGLPVAVYNGTITITSVGAVNSPLTVPVDLTITSPPAPPCIGCGGRIR